MRIWKFVLGIVAFAILLGFFLYFENNSVVVTRIEIKNEKVPAEFNGFKILHLSDLHSKRFGQNQRILVTLIKKSRPDIIVFTGDLVDREHYDEKADVILLERAAEVAPVYYVTGNHEWWVGKFHVLEPNLVRAGVQVLRDDNTGITRKGQTIRVIGIDDVARDGSAYTMEAAARTRLDIAAKDLPGEDFKILLAHRPELFSVYGEYDVDLVLSGHTHGGQIRLPFLGGLIAPNQGFFPKYTSGTHKFGNMTVVINRGLGNSVVPQRIFNRPEIILITLRK